MGIVYTSQQKKLIKTLLSNKSTVVEALAGCAKTSTIFEWFKHNQVKSNPSKILLISFNQHLQAEYQTLIRKYKLSTTVSTFTIHKLCKSYTMDIGATISIDGVRYTIKRGTTIRQFIHGYDLKEWSKSKESQWSILNEFNEFNNSNTDIDYASTSIKNIYEYMLSNDIITHDMYVKLFKILLSRGEVSMDYDAVVLDECQDANQQLGDIFNKLPIKQKVMVGDKNQELYLFLTKGYSLFNSECASDMVKLELTKTFRCSSIITDISDKMLRRYMFYKGSYYEGMSYNYTDIKCKSEFILTRTNADVLLACYGLARQGKTYRVSVSLSEIKRSFLGMLHILKLSPLLENNYKYSDFIRSVKSKFPDIEISKHNEKTFKGVFQDKFNNKIPTDMKIFDYLCSKDNELNKMNSLRIRLNTYKLNFNTLYGVVKKNVNSKSNTLVSTVFKVKGLEADMVTLYNLSSLEEIAESVIETIQYYLFKNSENELRTEIKEFLKYNSYLDCYYSFRDTLLALCNEDITLAVKDFIIELNIIYVAITRAKYEVKFTLTDPTGYWLFNTNNSPLSVKDIATNN